MSHKPHIHFELDCSATVATNQTVYAASGDSGSTSNAAGSVASLQVGVSV